MEYYFFITTVAYKPPRITNIALKKIRKIDALHQKKEEVKSRHKMLCVG